MEEQDLKKKLLMETKNKEERHMIEDEVKMIEKKNKKKCISERQIH